MLQLVRAVLYVSPTQTAAESAFSVQKWLLSGRRATMIPANRNLQMIGRSCMRLKRWIDEVKTEIHIREKQKLIEFWLKKLNQNSFVREVNKHIP